MPRSKKVQKALKHPDRLGAGAKARRKAGLSESETYEAVMAEFNRGTLNSGSGHRVGSRAQAKAIAASEARRNKRP